MKRFFITALIASISIASFAQPRAAGIRIGTTGADLSYQHSLSWDKFIEGEAGVDFGATPTSGAGFKAAATFNFIWARPAWTDRGTWALYSGPGIALGFVADKVTQKFNDGKLSTNDNGFMLSVVAQAGIEYTFWFPLQLSLDIRPYFGMHCSNGYEITFTGPDGTSASASYGEKTGFYERGLLGFIPTLSARFRF